MISFKEYSLTEAEGLQYGKGGRLAGGIGATTTIWWNGKRIGMTYKMGSTFRIDFDNTKVDTYIDRNVDGFMKLNNPKTLPAAKKKIEVIIANNPKIFKGFISESKAAMAKLAALKAKNAPKKEAPKVTQADLNNLERVLDRLFKDLNIDIEFTRHFLDRVNDARNKKGITIEELNALFTKAHNKHGTTLKNKPDDFQAILKSIMTKINVPFVIKLNKGGMIELVAKTVMRKADFKSSNQELKV